MTQRVVRMMVGVTGGAVVGLWAYRSGYPLTREVTMGMLQKPEASSLEVARAEKFWNDLQGKESHSLLKKYFTRSVLDQLKNRKTKLGATLGDVVSSGATHPDCHIGVYAPDAESYETFKELFNPIIYEYHKIGAKDKQPPVDLGKDKLGEFKDLDPEGRYILSTRIRCARSLKGYPFNPMLSSDDYVIMERRVKDALEAMPDPQLRGKYYPLTGMDKKTQNQLIQDHFLFKEGDKYLQAANACRFWPTGRGIFHNNDKTFLVWVNEEDHMRIISMQKGGDVGAVLKRLINAVEAIEAKVPFSRDDRLGWLTFCPTNLGSTVRASVHIKLPKLTARKDFKDICEKLNLQPRGVHGEGSDAEGGIYDISNKARLGFSEYAAVKQMYDGVQELIKMEKAEK